LSQLRRLISQASGRAKARIKAIKGLVLQCDALAKMEYDFLFDKKRHLLAIGYNVSEHRRDASYYDLLASEARLSSFVAIAQGQLPQESWFALGRLLTIAKREPILLSWSGSMFEYLMPLLVMPTYEDTLLDQTCQAAVARQIAYGKKSAGCRGAFLSVVTMPLMRIATTNTVPLASPAWGSNAGYPMTW
jgi:cyclic beta-1,2-glucan synthetase